MARRRPTALRSAAERAIGLRCGLAWLEVADEVLVAGPVSDGMRCEIARASELGVRVVFREEPE